MNSSSATSQSVALVTDPAEPMFASAPVTWALDQLAAALAAHGATVSHVASQDALSPGQAAIICVGPHRSVAGAPSAPAQAESLALGSDGGATPRTYAVGSDVRGLAYALTELADRVRHSDNWQQAIRLAQPITEAPSTRLRSIARAFCSNTEDPAWFYDRAQWCAYLDMLATNRFNRFALTLGMQYNYPYHNQWISDTYLYFPYPFLLAVPGYDVRVPELPDGERDRNFAMLRFIGEETAKRGMDFQLALWTHGYDFDDVPNANYNVLGITKDNHARYCRDALAIILKSVPSITGVTLRVHVEGGIAEGDYDFWRVLFEGITAAGRPIEIDMHAKGIDQVMIDTALATGMPVNISAKYIAEHMALPYHQAGIRELEYPPDGPVGERMAFSEGSRRFLRYGYGDLLREDRDYGVLFRIWAGTQRVLLWGDPALAAGYGRSAAYCDCLGVELCEPLFFAGRMGSGVPHLRFNYADETLRPRHDWEKYLYQYRVWGRLNYNPQHPADGWQRHLRTTCGAAAPHLEAALAHASRVLQLVTLAYAPSASNNSYWPELHPNASLLQEPDGRPHGADTPKPARFGTASTLDPQLFLNPVEFVAALRDGELPAKYTPLDVALWLERCAETAENALQAAERAGLDGAEPRRIALDAAIQAAMGRYFAEKFRAGCWWELYVATADGTAAAAALAAYRRARAAWQQAADVSRDAYLPDLCYGPQPYMRGSWASRLPAIDADIAAVEKHVAQHPGTPAAAAGLVQAVQDWQPMVAGQCTHQPPAAFTRGAPLQVTASADAASVWLHFRHVNQSERWRRVPMQRDGAHFTASIDAAYTDSAYPLQYYFECRDGMTARLYPGLAGDLANEPYFTLRPS